MSSIDFKSLILARQRAAKSYRQAAFLQNEIADRMLERLDYIRIKPKVILNSGARIGNTTRLLAKKYPKATIIASDLSQRMLQQMPTKWWQSRPKVFCAHPIQLPLANQSVDMIFSNLDLHWVDDLIKCFAEFRRVLKPDGLLMFTLLGPDSLRELRESFISATQQLNHVHEFSDMHDVGDVLLKSQLVDPVMDMEQITVNYKTVKKLLLDIKECGGQNARADKPRNLMGKNNWQKMLNAYEAQRVGGKLPATFEIIYGHAWGPKHPIGANANDKGEVVVPLRFVKK